MSNLSIIPALLVLLLKFAWLPLAGSTVRAAADRVVGEATRTGRYAVFDAPLPEVEEEMGEDGGGGGCAMAPVFPADGGPLDPMLPALVGSLLAFLVWKRRRRFRQAALSMIF